MEQHAIICDRCRRTIADLPKPAPARPNALTEEALITWHRVTLIDPQKTQSGPWVTKDLCPSCYAGVARAAEPVEHAQVKRGHDDR